MEQTPIKYHKIVLSYISSLHIWAEVGRIDFLLRVCRLRRLFCWSITVREHVNQINDPGRRGNICIIKPTSRLLVWLTLLMLWHMQTPSAHRLSKTAGIGVEFSGNHQTSTCFSAEVSAWLNHTIYLENRGNLKLSRIQDSEEIQL